MKTITQLKKLFFLSILFLMVGNVWGQIIIPVPFISQGLQGCSNSQTSNFNTSFCGHTCAEMIMSYYEPHNVSMANIQLYNSMIENQFHGGQNNFCGTGTPNPNHLIWLFNQFGYNSKWYSTSNLSYGNNSGLKQNLQELLNELSLGNIVMFQCGLGFQNTNTIGMQSQAHWMLLKGYDITTDEIIVNDPGKSAGNSRRYSKSSFDSSWGNSFKICLVVSNTEPLNQNLSIYGGSVNNPKSFYLYFRENSFAGNFTTSMISNIKIEGMQNNVVPNSRIISNDQQIIDGIGWRRLKIQLQIADLALINNAHDGRKLSFNLTSAGTTKTYSNNELYFADYQNSNTTFSDINDLNNWVESYVRKGASLGLFKGTSLQTFNPSGTLQRQHAAKIIVEAGVRLGLLNINISTTGGTFNDVSSSSEFFKHIQTLRNYGYISSSTTFNPTNAITIGQLCKLLVNVFQISNSDIASANFINVSQRRIVPVHSDTTLIPFMATILKLVDIRENTPGFFFTENLWDFLDFSSVNAIVSGQIQVNGSNPISRGIMAKLITNIMIWKANKMNLTMFRTANSNLSSQNINDYISFGEKYDNTSIPATSTPITPTQQTYSVASGGNITILYNSGSLPQHYYWSMQKNGATLVTNNTSHSSVIFTAPTVSTPTQWKLYTYTANNKGKARETFITINVGGSSGGTSAAPTVQAHSLNLYGATSTSITANWTRGNGQNCIVTCTEVGTNAQDFPDAGVIYSGNLNYSIAPTIFNGSDTKVVFTGTGNSCIINGLNPNTQYQVAVFEYSGNTPATVIYNLNSAPISQSQTINPSAPQPPTVSMTWSPEMPFTNNTSVNFTGIANNFTSLVWSTTGNATILSGQGTLNAVIAMGNTGNASVRLTANNSTTSLSNSTNLYTQILSPNSLLPDLLVTNSSISTALIPNQNFTVNVEQKNQGINYLSTTSTWTKFYLSDDNVLNVGDYNFNTDYIVQNSIPSQGIINFSKTILLPTWVETGNKFILVQADGAVNVTESNENNNVFAIPITVTNAPCDYFISGFSVSPSTLKAGQVFTPTLNIQNTGVCNSVFSGVQFYYSTDNILSTDDIPFSSYLLQFGIGTQKMSNTITNGNYFIIAAIDYGIYGYGFDQNLESNENNNYASFPITINNIGQPTVQTSNFELTNIADTSLTFSWQNGNGNSRTVIANKDNLPFLPNDNTTFTPNLNFVNAPLVTSINTSTSKVLYSGINNSIAVTGLIAGNDYLFTTIEQNASGPDYLHNFSDSNFIKTNNINNAEEFIHTYIGNTTQNNWTKKTSFAYNFSIYKNKPIDFINDNLGFYVNERYVHRTIDGGKSWVAKQVSSNDLNSIKFIDASIGWVVGSNGLIAKTINGGQNWLQQTLPLQFQAYNFNSICLSDATTVYVCGSNTINQGVVLKTTNGGSTWTNIFTAPNQLFTITNIGSNIWVGGDNKKIFKSSNEGTTWSDISFTNLSSNLAISKIQFMDANIGWASFVAHNFNGGSLFLKTTDGGVSWSAINIPLPGSGLSDFEFDNLNIGYATSGNWFGKTMDGGLSWTLTPNSSSIDGVKLKIIDNNKIAIVTTGNNHGLWISNSGGTTNSISINAINNTYCNNSTIVLPYTITGNFDTTNNFVVQLSDSNGSFSNPTILNTFTNVGNGTLNVALNSSIINGSNYKIRLMASNPTIISNETNAFSVTTANSFAVAATPSSTTICPNTSITYTATPSNGGATPTYVWKKNGQIVGTNSNLYTTSTIQNQDVVWVEMVSNATCSSTTPAISQPITVAVTQINELFIQAIDDILAASTDFGVQWILNGQPIAGATSQFYQATQTGFYQFSVTVDGCTVLSDIYSLTTLGTDTNNFENNKLKVFPNPFQDFLTIVAKEDNLQYLQLIDLQGRIIKQEKVSGGNHQFNLESLPQGVYILQISSDKGMQSVKVIRK